MPELLATIVEHLPELIAGLVFLYALITLLLSTFHLITGMRQARARLTEVATRDQLLAIFAQTGLKRLGPRIVDPAPSEGSMRDPALIRSRFGFEPARREMGRLYVDRLARRQFFTVIAGLLAYITTPAIEWATARSRMPRPLFALVAFTVFLLFAIAIGYLGIPPLASETTHLFNDFEGIHP